MDIIKLIGFTFGKRYSKRQKSQFIHLLDSFDYRKNAETVVIPAGKYSLNRQGSYLSKSFQANRILLMANYDTPALQFIGRRQLNPFDRVTNYRQVIKALVLRSLFFSILSMTAVWIIRTAIHLHRGSSLFLMIGALLMFILAVAGLNGFANPVNLNRNSMSLIVSEQVMARCPVSVLYYEAEPFLTLNNPLPSELMEKIHGYCTIIQLNFISSGSRCIIRCHPSQATLSAGIVERLKSCPDMDVEMRVLDDVDLPIIQICCVNEQGLVEPTKGQNDNRMNSVWLETLVKELSRICI